MKSGEPSGEPVPRLYLGLLTKSCTPPKLANAVYHSITTGPRSWGPLRLDTGRAEAVKLRTVVVEFPLRSFTPLMAKKLVPLVIGLMVVTTTVRASPLRKETEAMPRLPPTALLTT